MNNLISEKSKVFNSNGVIVEVNLISKDDVSKAIDSLNLFFNENKDKLEEGKEVNFADKSKNIINSLHRLENYKGYFFNELSKRKKIIDLANELIGSDSKLISIQAFVKPGSFGLPAPYHQDNAYWCIEPPDGLTIWIALDECNKENGMINYIIGSHKAGVVKHTPSLAPGSSQIIVDADLPDGALRNPSSMPGDAAIHHTMNVHGSNPNNSGKQRRGLLLCYQSKKSIRNIDLFDRYQKNLETLIKLRNSQ